MIIFCLLAAAGSHIACAQNTKEELQNDWRTWRGPNSNGTIENQKPPTQWSAEENVVWKTRVPGRGHASPTIVGDKILLATADESAKTQSVLAFSRESGEKLWETELHSGNFLENVHRKNTHASQTVASDGNHAFAVFCNDDKVWVTALTLDGTEVWERQVGTYQSKRGFGFGTSPIFGDGKLFVTSESESDAFLLALNPTDGKEIYRIDLPKSTSYSVPVLATVAGKRQLLMYGSQQIASYDPETGDELWQVKGQWEVTCGTMIWDDDLVFASGGYPAQQTIAVRADGSSAIVWENSVKVYEQSMIIVDGYIYGQAERGIIYCWRASDGKEMWKKRAKGPESASPVLAGGNIYFTNELGTTFVIKPNPEQFELLAQNQLGSSSFASMTMLDNRIYTRVAEDRDGSRQEWLYCLGEK